MLHAEGDATNLQQKDINASGLIIPENLHRQGKYADLVKMENSGLVMEKTHTQDKIRHDKTRQCNRRLKKATECKPRGKTT